MSCKDISIFLMGPTSWSDCIEGTLSPKLKVYDSKPLWISVWCTTCDDVLRTHDDGGHIQHDSCVNEQLTLSIITCHPQ